MVGTGQCHCRHGLTLRLEPLHQRQKANQEQSTSRFSSSNSSRSKRKDRRRCSQNTQQHASCSPLCLWHHAKVDSLHTHACMHYLTSCTRITRQTRRGGLCVCVFACVRVFACVCVFACMYVCVPHAPGDGRAHLELRKNAGSTSNDALDLDEGVEVCLANVTNGIENRQRPDPHVDVALDQVVV